MLPLASSYWWSVIFITHLTTMKTQMLSLNHIHHVTTRGCTSPCQFLRVKKIKPSSYSHRKQENDKFTNQFHAIWRRKKQVNDQEWLKYKIETADIFLFANSLFNRNSTRFSKFWIKILIYRFRPENKLFGVQNFRTLIITYIWIIVP